NPMFTSDNADEVATIIKDIIGTRRISNSLLASARRKLEHLESKFESTWTNSSYAVNSKKRQQPENTHYYESKQRRIADNDIGDKSETDPNDEADFDNSKVSSIDSNIVLTDSDTDNNK
ncbi:10812_t:CDS:2, partial [Scutellospora calospora]